MLPPELGGGLLWTELPLLPPPLPPEFDREGPESFMKFSCGTSRRGSGDLPTPGEGAGPAGAEAALEPDTLPELALGLGLPLEPELEPALVESRVMLGGNMRRGSGTLPRPEEGEVSSEAAPESPPPLDRDPPELEPPPAKIGAREF